MAVVEPDEQNTLDVLADARRYQLLSPVISNAPLEANRTPDMHAPVQPASGLWDALVSGMETSTTGLFLRGKSPDVVLDIEAPRAERIAHMVGMTIGDLPTLVVGGVVGGAALAPTGPVGVVAGGGAGAMGLTEGVRTWLLESYDKGHTKRDLADRLTATAYAVGKGVIIGGATGAVGGKLKGVLSAVTSPVGPVRPAVQSAMARAGITSAAELSTMVTVAHGLEGELPGPDDFLEGAILLGGFKSAAMVAAKMRTTYERTGVTPKQQAQDALNDSETFQDYVDPVGEAVPRRYRDQEQSPLRPDGTRFEEIPKAKPAEGEAQPKPELDEMKFLNEPREEPVVTRVKAFINNDTFDFEAGPRQLADELTRQNMADMARAQGGKQTWEMQEHQSMAYIRQVMGEGGLKVLEGEVGTLRHAAMAKSIYDMLHTTLRVVDERMAPLREKLKAGGKLTDEERLDLRADLEVARRIQRLDRAASSSTARALQYRQKKRANPELEQNREEMQNLLKSQGGADADAALITLMGEIKDPAARARVIRTPTFGGKLLEAWKAGLLWGPSTVQINLFSGIAFGFTRIPKEVIAATFSKFRPGSAEHVAYTDAVALTAGMGIGAWRALRAAGQSINLKMDAEGSWLKGLWAAYKEVGTPTKAEGAPVPQIGGWLGQVIRAPFKGLAAGDVLVRTMNEQGTLFDMASRIAVKEGRTVFSKDYWNRVNELVNKPTKKMREQAENDATRYLFQQDGPVINAVERFRNDIPALHVVAPFVRAPANIFKEFVRHSPLAPVIKQFREDFAKGGAERDRAVAEVTMGMALAIPVFLLARDGVITGAGHPDQETRTAQYEAGFKQYSIKFKDGSMVGYGRWEPVSTLMGMAANLATVWDLMEAGEQDRAAAALMWAGVEVAKNKTWLKGAVSFVNAIGDPERYGAPWLESLAGSLVPNVFGQVAREMDPYVREVDSIRAAVVSRIPVAREKWLRPRYDSYGQPIEASESALYPTFPSLTGQMTTDKVRREAARLGVSAGRIPRSLSAGSVSGESAMVELTPEQQEMFAQKSGSLAYQVLSQTVNSPGWDSMNYLVQRRIYERVFAMARRQGAMETLPPDQRAAAIQGLIEQYGL